MSVLPAPFLLPVDWWALGAVLALSVWRWWRSSPPPWP
jgi:hypothetical protein